MAEGGDIMAVTAHLKVVSPWIELMGAVSGYFCDYATLSLCGR